MSGLKVPSAQPEGVIPIRIQTWAAGGRGLGRVDGRVWMVVGGVPGDVVFARVVKDHGRFVEAVADGLAEASPARRVPPCGIQGECGGCPLMAVDEPAQRDAKRRFLVDALERIGRLPAGLPVDALVDVPPPLAYRNRVEFTFGNTEGAGRVLGYHRAGQPMALVDVSVCTIADPRLQPLLSAARGFFLEGPGVSDPAVLDTRQPLRLVLRASGANDERLVAFRGLDGPFPTLQEFARLAAAADPGLVGVVRLIAAPGRRGGTRVDTIAGRSWVADEFHGISFRVPAATFLQVHHGAAQALGAHVLAGAGSPRRVVELYGGVGALGLALARSGAEATIVDADPMATACGAEAAQSHGLTRAEFVRSDVLAFLNRGDRRPVPDLVIADPPRTGLGRGVADRLAGLGVRRIAMVSCDSATLARDLAALSASGYAIERITPFDLFPQTAHVETVAWLTRESGARA